MTQHKQPPPGVETSPDGPTVPVREAAALLGKDPRTVIRAIVDGQIRGGARPGAQRLRWYVYADELRRDKSGATARAAAAPWLAELEDLRAQNVSLREINRLLIAAQQDLLDAGAAADGYRAAAGRYLDALAQLMTPGHLGELTRER